MALKSDGAINLLASQDYASLTGKNSSASGSIDKNEMKIKKTTIAFYVGLFLGAGPWFFLQNPGIGAYFVSLFGAMLVTTVGFGARMESYGKGDTAEELLDEIWAWVKRKTSRK